MFEPEYRASFRVLIREIGLWPTIRISIPTILRSRNKLEKDDDLADESEKRKIALKNHFKPLAMIYKKLIKRYGEERTKEIMHEILIHCGPVFMRGFKPLDSNMNLNDFIPIYKTFESQNLVFEVIEESSHRFEVEVKRCLIFEAFYELGLESLTQWMCEIAFLYFKDYHPNIKYTKDQMIAKGDNRCHEIFIWQEQDVDICLELQKIKRKERILSSPFEVCNQ